MNLAKYKGSWVFAYPIGWNYEGLLSLARVLFSFSKSSGFFFFFCIILYINKTLLFKITSTNGSGLNKSLISTHILAAIKMYCGQL